MNAGAYGGEMKDIVKSVRLMDTDGNILDFTNEQMEFSYRRSILSRTDYIVLSAQIELENGSYDEIKATMADFTQRRVTKQPLSLPSAGSTFKRPEGHFAAKLIDDSGLRGLTLRGDVSTLLDRISGLPAQQRSMETLLRMLSEHLRVSVILTEHRRDMNTVVYWPRSLETVVADKLPGWLKELGGGSELRVPLGDGVGYLQSCPHLLSDSDNLRLYTLKYREPLGEDALWQSSECVRLFIHIWNKNHGKSVVSELVRAIINDETIHRQRLAQLFKIRTEDLNQMWLFIPRHEPVEHDEGLLRSCTDYFSAFSDPVLVSYYEDTLVVFTHALRGSTHGDGEFFGSREQFEAISSRYEIICCDSLASSADARRAYLVSMANWRAARRIYPRASVLRTADVMFAQLCQEIMSKRETLEQYEQSLSGLRSSNSELIPTLMVYLLDAGSSMAETAKLLYVHLNTVKYRLRQIQELTGLSPTQMPDSYSLYIAAAIDRISGE